MTQTPPTNRPLTGEDVKLLKAGDVLRRIDGRVSIHGLEYESGLSGTYLDGSTHANSPPSHFTFLGRPDAYGWIPNPGFNPAPGVRIQILWDTGNTVAGAPSSWLANPDCTHWRPVSRPTQPEPERDVVVERLKNHLRLLVLPCDDDGHSRLKVREDDLRHVLTLLEEARGDAVRSEAHRNDLADKITSQSTEIGALKVRLEPAERQRDEAVRLLAEIRRLQTQGPGMDARIDALLQSIGGDQ